MAQWISGIECAFCACPLSAQHSVCLSIVALKLAYLLASALHSCHLSGLALCLCLSQRRLNLTKTVRKTSINNDMQRVGMVTVDNSNSRQDPKYDDEGTFVSVRFSSLFPCLL